MSKTSNCLASTAVRLTMRHPFWSEIFYSMTVVETADDAACPTAGTDSRLFIVNTTFWAKLTPDEKVGVAAHELGHKIFLHCTRRGTRDAKRWNAACDFAINAILHDNSFVLPKPHLHDVKYAGMSAEAIYTALTNEQKARGKGAEKGEAKDGQGTPIPGVPTAWDDLVDIRAATGSPEEIEALEIEAKALVERAVANARAHGKLPKGIASGISVSYRPASEPWFNHLHRYMQSLSTSEYNWSRLNRRTLRTHGTFTPLHQSEALGEVALFIDTSGSCFVASEQANFAAHMNAILSEARPRRIQLYYFDSQVYQGEVIEAGELDVSTHPKGGGGTDFHPIFDAIESDGLTPEVVIILTDLYGSFPSGAPTYPVVWASTSSEVAPFGETIYIGGDL